MVSTGRNLTIPLLLVFCGSQNKDPLFTGSQHFHALLYSFLPTIGPEQRHLCQTQDHSTQHTYCQPLYARCCISESVSALCTPLLLCIVYWDLVGCKRHRRPPIVQCWFKWWLFKTFVIKMTVSTGSPERHICKKTSNFTYVSNSLFVKYQLFAAYWVLCVLNTYELCNYCSSTTQYGSDGEPF